MLLDDKTKNDIKTLIELSKKLDLTCREAEVLCFIDTATRKYGRSPTLQEIANNFVLKSTNSAQQIIRQLESKKYISVTSNISRGVRINQPAHNI